MNGNTKRLYRSKTDSVIAGVCGGLGKYFEVDPVLFRLLFIVFTLAGGSGIIIYIIMALVIPDENSSTEPMEQTLKRNAEELKNRAESFAQEMSTGTKSNSRIWLGIFIVCLGVYFLLGTLGVKLLNFNAIWPVILIALGVFLIFRTSRHG